MRRRVGWVGEAKELSRPFFELPAAIQDRTVPAELIEHGQPGVQQVVRVSEQCPASVLDPSPLGRRR
jgi:hypothetical protein